MKIISLILIPILLITFSCSGVCAEDVSSEALSPPSMLGEEVEEPDRSLSAEEIIEFKKQGDIAELIINEYFDLKYKIDTKDEGIRRDIEYPVKSNKLKRLLVVFVFFATVVLIIGLIVVFTNLDSVVLQTYVQFVDSKPIISGMVSTGIIVGIGDIITQFIFRDRLSLKRLSYMCCIGFLFFGVLFPLWHYYIVPLLSYFGIIATFLKISIDQTIIAFISISMFIILMELFQGGDIKAIKTSWKREFLPFPGRIMKVNWVWWVPVSIITFTCFPIQYRILVMNIAAIPWNVYMSYRGHLRKSRLCKKIIEGIKERKTNRTKNIELLQYIFDNLKDEKYGKTELKLIIQEILGGIGLTFDDNLIQGDNLDSLSVKLAV